MTRLLLLFVLLVIPAAAPAAAPLAHREVLPNGIVLLVAERPAVPIVAAWLLVLSAKPLPDSISRKGDWCLGME